MNFFKTKKTALLIAFLVISTVISLKIILTGWRYGANDYGEVSAKVEKVADITNDNYGNSAKLAAYDLAADFVRKSLNEPTSAEFPGRKRLDHVTPLGNNRYRINSWVDSQDTYGAMRRRGFSCIVEMNKKNVNQESFQIEKYGHIPKDF